tara:strand:+ start:59 stop:493 length:435 start_codon:yes stop_codon:yes gene_type:complete
MDKYLYFRSVADEDNDDGDGASAGINPTSLCIPVRNITGMHAQGGTAVDIQFETVKNAPGFAGGTNEEVISDNITISVNSHTQQQVIDELIRAINDSVHNDGFITVFDGVTTNTADETVEAIKLHPDISGIGANKIVVRAALTA